MRAIHVALPALLLAGCGLLYAEVEIPSVQLTLPQETIPGAGAGTTFDDTFKFDLGKDVSIITENDVTVSLKLQTLSIGSATVDLSGVQTLLVEVVPPLGSTLPTLTLLTYHRPSPYTPPIHSVEAASASGDDLGPYLTAGEISLHVSGSGAPPTSDWVGKVVAAFYLKVRYPYGKKL